MYSGQGSSVQGQVAMGQMMPSSDVTSSYFVHGQMVGQSDAPTQSIQPGYAKQGSVGQTPSIVYGSSGSTGQMFGQSTAGAMNIQPGYAQQGQLSSLIYASTDQIGQQPHAGGAMNIQPGYAQQGQLSSLIYASTGQIGQQHPAGGAMNIQPGYAHQGQLSSLIYASTDQIGQQPHAGGAMNIQPSYAQQGQPSSFIYGSTGQIGQQPHAGGAMNIQPSYAHQGQTTTTTLYPQIEHLVMRPTRFDVQPGYQVNPRLTLICKHKLACIHKLNSWLRDPQDLMFSLVMHFSPRLRQLIKYSLACQDMEVCT